MEVELKAGDLVPAGSRTTVLRQGEQLWFDADGRVSQIESFDHALVGAWKEGQLIFQEQPLVKLSSKSRAIDPKRFVCSTPAWPPSP